jgi:CRISPR system Cascade subunit CasB
MITTETSTYLQRETDFLEHLHKRIANDNGAKAALKRALSGEPKHLRSVYSLVLPYLDGIPDWKQDHIWIPVVCLSVYYPQPIRGKKHNFGHSCRQLANKTESEGMERRFRALLDTTLADIQTPITALVRQMKSKEVAIDYPQLIFDLNGWEHPDQYIQDKWARTFWGVPTTQHEETEQA